MEVDCMHSAIEHAEKNITITSMRQWLTVFSMARSNRNWHKIKNKKPMKEAYRVKELKHSDFIDLKALGATMIKNRTQDTEKKTVQWLKIKRMHFEKANSNVVFFSYEYNGPYKELIVHGKPQGRPEAINLKELYSSEVPISQAKKRDLLRLCKNGVIPKEDHRFFQALKTKKESTTDLTPEPSNEEYLEQD